MSATATLRQTVPVDTAAERFRPVFDRIAAGAVERERNRVLAREPVEWLREAGFGALRVPRALGGGGASLRELFALLVALGEADPNLPQILRAHFAFVEGQLAAAEPNRARQWLRLVANGAIFGAAMAEQGDVTGLSTVLRPDPDGSGGFRLDGHKYYSTGTLYADWIAVVAAEGADRVLVAVEADAPGVERLDDWDGFGQRLTASGTTRFRDVAVPAERILDRSDPSVLPTTPFFTVFYQLFHLAALAGIGRAVLRDAVAFVQPRTRTFYLPGTAVPRADPLVQRVVGRISALAFSAEALVDRVAVALDGVVVAVQAGTTRSDALQAVEIEAFQAQQVILPQVLEAATLLFEVGGASAVSDVRALDRHWRNARVLSSHNPAAQRERMLGDWFLNGVPPSAGWQEHWKKQELNDPSGRSGPGR